MITLTALEPLDSRVPKWNLMGLRSRSCPLCGKHHEPILERSDHLPVTYCPDCALWYLCKIPSQNEIYLFYQDYYQTHNPFDSSKLQPFLMRKQARMDAIKDIRLITLRALLKGLEGKKLLDVGCGLGSFLLRAQHFGAEVMGNELSKQASNFVKERLGIPILEAPLSQSVGRCPEFDVITMLDLVEHVEDPLDIIKSARFLLRSNGILLLWSPNGGAAGRNLDTSRDWVGFRADFDHLQYFSTGAMHKIALLSGWVIEHLETVGFPSRRVLGGLTPPGGSRSMAIRGIIKRLPGLTRLVRAVRAAAAELFSAKDWRDGNYHLFCILRKID